MPSVCVWQAPETTYSVRASRKPNALASGAEGAPLSKRERASSREKLVGSDDPHLNTQLSPDGRGAHQVGRQEGLSDSWVR